MKRLTRRVAAATLAVSTLMLAGCSNGQNPNESTGTEEALPGLELAYQACTNEESMEAITSLAAQAAAIDSRWRPMADYANSLKSAALLADRLDAEGRKATDAEIEIAAQGSADADKFISECDAVKALKTQ